MRTQLTIAALIVSIKTKNLIELMDTAIFYFSTSQRVKRLYALNRFAHNRFRRKLAHKKRM